MGMVFAPTWLRQVSPLLYMTTLTTGCKRRQAYKVSGSLLSSIGREMKTVGETAEWVRMSENRGWRPRAGVGFLGRDSKTLPTSRGPDYDFLLTFHSNNGHISFRFRDKRWLHLKIAKFSPPRVFYAPADDTHFLLEVGIGVRSQKLEWWGYQTVKKVSRYV